jgi:metal-sulfur cluster biosynthetic enzyme
VDEGTVYATLRDCYDPEIPLNIVDLGLIYDVRVMDDRVGVKMTLTTQGCGMGQYIASEAEEKIRALPGVQAATVEIVWDPPWTPDMISPAGRQVLGLPE